MCLQTAFELTITLDTERFQKLLKKIYGKSECPDKEKFIDDTMAPKGITITYHNSQYKKKVKLTVNPDRVTDSGEPDKIVRKLAKRINGYFGSSYRLNDFKLSGMNFVTHIDVGDREKVGSYLRVLQRIGKVKGYKPPTDDWFDDGISFCLDGNSNAIQFMIYDLEGLLREQMEMSDSKRKQLKSIAKKVGGLLRVEVRLTKPKAIRRYTDEVTTSEQVADMCKRRERTFGDVFRQIIPSGDFHKKDRAAEIMRKKVTDRAMRRRMLRLIELIPEKKSLLLAQKALNYRGIDDVMEMFEKIEVSPVTISKRHDIKKLDNLYKYL